MLYHSTRGAAPPRDFAAVLLAGLAEDGGLFTPEHWPRFTADQFRAMRSLSYPDLAATIIAPFTQGAIDEPTLRALCHEAYRGFTHPAIAPLVQLDHGLWVLELFHGPTLAFKDMAMQLLGGLFAHLLAREGRRITIVAATSGDTGSAAIEALANRPCIDLVVLHPQGRTSEVQRRQMTTVHAPNIANIAIDGSFDDCQDLVKALFADPILRAEFNLSAVNSINWARIAAQIPYYVYAALALGAPDRAVSFSVPTGNFGNVLAAYAAARIGLPIANLVVAANRNDILARFLAANDMSLAPVVPSLSPSMDIQVSSNFERLLFELLDRDPAATAATMRDFRATGRMPVSPAAWQRARALFTGFRLDDAQTLATMAHLHKTTGYLADPHSAIAIAGAATAAAEAPVIALATAHPAKFPDAVERATAIRPMLPPALATLYEREERFTCLPNRLDMVQDAVRQIVLRNAA
jgi:threonine synthase